MRPEHPANRADDAAQVHDRPLGGQRAMDRDELAGEQGRLARGPDDLAEVGLDRRADVPI